MALHASIPPNTFRLFAVFGQEHLESAFAVDTFSALTSGVVMSSIHTFTEPSVVWWTTSMRTWNH